jgi:hypothetical protein
MKTINKSRFVILLIFIGLFTTLALVGFAQPEKTEPPVVEVQIVTNSPIMLNEQLVLRLMVAKRQPVTITAMPPAIEAVLQIPAQPTAAGQPTPGMQTQTPTPPPSNIRFDLDQAQQVVSQQVEGRTIEQYAYKLTVPPAQVGEYVIAPITITYRTATGEEIKVNTKETSIFVMNPNTGNLAIKTDYRFLMLPGIVVLTALLGGFVVWLYLKYRKPRMRDITMVEPSLPPGELAHKELTQIRALKLPIKGEFKAYYTMISETVRKFLGAEFNFPVLERTTEEVLNDIQRRDLPDNVRKCTEIFLQEADLVKFAKYIPLIEETDAAMEQAFAIVDESIAYHQVKTAEQVYQSLQTG